MEQRLIDANYAIELIKDMRDLARADVLRDAIERIKAAPTVDAVPVCRCKDCKHYRKIDHGGICVVLAREEKMTDDFYCADGERR